VRDDALRDACQATNAAPASIGFEAT
jgi:hypothetical protein